jgi:hypothetical protein
LKRLMHVSLAAASVHCFQAASSLLLPEITAANSIFCSVSR